MERKNKKIKIGILSLILIVFTFNIINAATVAMCSDVGDIKINIPSEVGIKTKLPVITLNITDSSIKQTSKWRANLYDTSNKILGTTQVGGFSNGLGFVDFGYTPEKSANITISVGLCEGTASGTTCSTGIWRYTNKTIQVKKTFDLNIFCQNANAGTVIKVNDKVTCTMEPTEVTEGAIGTGLLVNIDTPTISVNQGTDLLTAPSQKTTKGWSFTFTPSNAGTIDIDVFATASGFVSVNDEKQIEVLDRTGAQKVFKLDGVTYATEAKDINTGTRKLTFTYDDTVIANSIQSIKGTMVNPSGGETPVEFKKVGTEWTLTYDFTQAGQQYILKVLVVTTGNTEGENYNLPITTLSAKSEKDTATANNIIIFIVVGVVTLIIIIVSFIFFFKGKKKRR